MPPMFRAMVEKLHIVWFKRDLRTRDHAALSMAAARGPVLPLYVVEPAFWAEPDAAGRHWDFIAQSLAELRKDLAALGQPLVLRRGDILDVLDAFDREPGIAALYSHQETGNGWTYARDQRVAAWCRARGIPWQEPVQGGVVRRLPSRHGWAKGMDQFLAAPQIAAPALRPVPVDPGAIIRPDLPDDPCPDRQPGGRQAGLSLLGSFLTERAKPYRRAMSAPGPGAVHCSRLSPHLAFGTLSVREVAQATWARQREVKETGERGFTGALSSFNGRLHWRDHFMQKLEDAPRIEFENMHRGMDRVQRESDAARLHAFAVGETGLPFVDACMRSLRATGWMNFRMRAMLQAVASYHLWLPWRDSGMVLARLFTDFEPGIHWSQVQMQSGTTGINTIRVYNPVKQGYDQDPDGTFIRQWVPELRGFEGTKLHEPWKQGGAPGYPDPIVDHEQAARDAKAAIYAARKGNDFRDEADRIQARHGSRKSGIRNRGQRRKAPSAQLSLDL
ncbi:deoxyribodipyrimidine photo-lyase [Rubricella aquisinus]|uniref:Deoxyribodipyrimidine photo-lyase n=1 Tax=Rubricella aquisinus TaxID=2028108 RepID=A0A840X5U2_9RHOB|nr:deoxyribodipyrimidine photo-lyase [Rubricella aquisinus]MBB5517195.1 deoxyribodipyrimidine photo-lyase [Rubricella aquisinus]